MKSSEIQTANKVNDNICEGSVLERTWKTYVVSSWSFFIAYQLFMCLNHAFSSNPICALPVNGYSDVFWYIHYCCLGAFIFIWITLVIKLFQFNDARHKRIPLLVSFSIVTMTTIATFLAVVVKSGGFCLDVLNVASAAPIWGDWMVRTYMSLQ